MKKCEAFKQLNNTCMTITIYGFPPATALNTLPKYISDACNWKHTLWNTCQLLQNILLRLSLSQVSISLWAGSKSQSGQPIDLHHHQLGQMANKMPQYIWVESSITLDERSLCILLLQMQCLVIILKKKHGTSSLLPTFCSKFMNRALNGLRGEL